MSYKLGKLPAVKNSIPHRLRDYLSLTTLPVPPDNSVVGLSLADSNTFGNTKYGDCVCAGAGHETLLWNHEAQRTVNLTTDNVLAMYSAITGFTLDDPSTDQGTNIVDAALWRKNHGLVDDDGKVHQVGAYAALTPGNIEEVKQAIYMFGAVGIGWALPKSALTQAQKNEPWSVVSSSSLAGGHYTAAIGYDPSYLYIISWGQVIRVEWDFFARYNDEGIVYFSDDQLNNDTSPSGFNGEQLLQDLEQL